MGWWLQPEGWEMQCVMNLYLRVGCSSIGEGVVEEVVKELLPQLFLDVIPHREGVVFKQVPP